MQLYYSEFSYSVSSEAYCTHESGHSHVLGASYKKCHSKFRSLQPVIPILSKLTIYKLMKSGKTNDSGLNGSRHFLNYT
jgi:hypothetical protein